MEFIRLATRGHAYTHAPRPTSATSLRPSARHSSRGAGSTDSSTMPEASGGLAPAPAASADERLAFSALLMNAKSRPCCDYMGWDSGCAFAGVCEAAADAVESADDCHRPLGRMRAVRACAATRAQGAGATAWLASDWCAHLDLSSELRALCLGQRRPVRHDLGLPRSVAALGQRRGGRCSCGVVRRQRAAVPVRAIGGRRGAGARGRGAGTVQHRRPAAAPLLRRTQAATRMGLRRACSPAVTTIVAL